MPAQQPIGVFRDVSLIYGKLIALDDVTLDIPRGVVVGLIGPDGVGKSSLLALLAGVRQMQDGEVSVLGGNIADARHRAAICPRIAYMPQGLGRNLYPDLSVHENIDFFGRLFGQSRAEREARITELLEATGLENFRDRPAGKLSGGMRQKLGLCCALIHDPDLLILDEPTTGVDPLSRRQFWTLIIQHARARARDMSVVVATAYMDEAEQFDWLVAMDAGRTLAQGTPADLKTRTGAATWRRPSSRFCRRSAAAVMRPSRFRRARRIDDEAVIVARGLTRRFGNFTAVDHVDFTIERGEIFGFRRLERLRQDDDDENADRPAARQRGRRRCCSGSEIDASTWRRASSVGYMSQSFSLYSELTVRQNLVLHARLFHLPTCAAPHR